MNSDQPTVFQECAIKQIDSYFKGYNATIMAYGQTGSGKTYTMGNCLESKEEDKGIIPRTIDEVFKRIDEQTEYSFTIRATFVEVYNEEIYDLWSTEEGGRFSRTKNHSVSLREEKDGSILLCGCKEEKIEQKEQLYLLLEQGSQRRSVGSTLMNDESSRSHALMTLILEKNNLTDDKDFTCSRFTFVDLAGSERLGRTEAVGKSMKEGININKGLLALGNVISALTDDTGKVTFIPYRVSKLTRILRNSLGGNSRTWMIACVSPVLADVDESLNTIKYATRARKISNTPIINKDPQSAIISQLKQQIFKLSQDVFRMKRIINQNGLTENLEAAEAEDQLNAVTSPGAQHKGLERMDSLLDIDANEAGPKLKAAEREIVKLKEERNKYKKELNEKNILYCKLIGRVTELRAQNQELVNAIEKLSSTGVVEEGAALLAKTDGANLSAGLASSFGLALASVVKQENTDELAALLKEIDSLKQKLSEKTKYSSTLEDEYTKLLKVSTKENEMLVEKVKECSELMNLVKKLEKEKAGLSSDRKITFDFRSSDISNSNFEPLLIPQTISTDETSTGQFEFAPPESPFVVDQNENIEDAIDTQKYLEEKMAREEELKHIMESLEQKEANLKQLLEKEQESDEVEAMTALEIINLDKLTELEKQLMDAKNERDEALKKLHEVPAVAGGISSDPKKPGRKDSASGKEVDISSKYKQKVTDLEHQIQELRKKDKDSKDFDSKLKEKNSKIEHLQSEIQKMKTQRLELDKRLREGSQSFAKSRMERQKEIFNIKKDLFKKNAEISRLKNLTRKQTLAFNKKLAEVKKANEKLFTKKSIKNVTPSTFEGIDVNGFNSFLHVYCQKICDHADLEAEVGNQTNVLLKYHSKLDDLLGEVAKIQVERQHHQGADDYQDELALLDEKEREFEMNMASCEEAIRIKHGYVAKLESELEETRRFINEGFTCLLNFLSEDTMGKEEFWQGALNQLMSELEALKKNQLEGVSKVKEIELQAADAQKAQADLKRNVQSLEQENERLKKEVEELNAKTDKEPALALNESAQVDSPGIKYPYNKHPTRTYTGIERMDTKVSERGNSSKRKFDVDGLRNKLINSEIQKDSAIKMAESLKAKYQQMQDFLSTMMENTGIKPPPSTVLNHEPMKTEKFTKPALGKKYLTSQNSMRRSGFGNSVNASFQQEKTRENSPSNAQPTTSRKKISNVNNTENILKDLSRENSRSKKKPFVQPSSAAAASQNSALNRSLQMGQAKLSSFQAEFEHITDEINLYQKEIKCK